MYRAVSIIVPVMMRMMVIISVVPVPITPIPVIPVPAPSVIPRIIRIPERVVIAVIAIVIRISEREYRNVDYA